MSTRVAELAVDVVSDVAKAVSGIDDVGTASSNASSDVAKMGREAQESARRLNITADSADELGGKAGKATGALGALSSGFELVGLEKYAGGLQAASMATDFFSGIGDTLNLVMESTAVKTAIAKVQMVGHAIASGASSAATGVMTAAQWALNAAMSANPIALVVIALVALVAAFVIAYKRSATFRAIVTGAFDAVTGAATAAFNWLKRNWPLLLAILTGPFGLAVLAIAKNWDKIKTGAQNAFANARTWLKDAGKAVVQGLIDGVDKMIDTLKDKLHDITSLIPLHKGPLDKDRRLLRPAGEGIMGGLIDSIKSKIPNLRNVLGLVTDTFTDVQPDLTANLTVTASGVTGSGSTGGAAPTVININVSGALDPQAVAQQIVDLLVRLARSLGVPVSRLFGALA